MQESVTLLSGFYGLYEENLDQDKNSHCMNLYYGSNAFHMRHISSQNITLEKDMRLEMSSVTLLSLKGALQSVLLILL